VLGALTELSPDGARAFDLPGRIAPPTPLFDRMAAAEALGARHDSSAAERLRAGLADTSALYVGSCAGALAEMGDRKSVPVLARTYAAHVADPDADARLSIRDALRTLAGVPFADSVERAHPPRAKTPASYDSTFQNPPTEKGARLVTTRGEIEWAFYGREAPQTVKNFVRLARRGYFDGLAVHRVVPNFVIQDGDPTGTGSGGPGYDPLRVQRAQYEPGMVGMALSGKDTGGSQWFITHSPQMPPERSLRIFAHVTRPRRRASRRAGDRILRVLILE
jgi:cyclophilin family peptidyl-prolyl cis-trans isomerase